MQQSPIVKSRLANGHDFHGDQQAFERNAHGPLVVVDRGQARQCCSTGGYEFGLQQKELVLSDCVGKNVSTE